MTSSTHDVGSPRVVSVAFTHRSTRMTVDLDDGRTISVPLAWYPRLRVASARERSRWRLVGGGAGVYWMDLDEDISVDNLLAGARSAENTRSFERWLAGRTATAAKR